MDGYIVTIVKNVSLNILKKETHDDPFPEEWDLPAEERDEVSTFDNLVALIRAMPEQYRVLLELKFVLGFSNREIAKKLDMNESTVATRIERGRKELIKKLNAEGYAYE
jgi:RNA polymerase sigma-70 factor (ECF subfamily)